MLHGQSAQGMPLTHVVVDQLAAATAWRVGGWATCWRRSSSSRGGATCRLHRGEYQAARGRLFNLHGATRVAAAPSPLRSMVSPPGIARPDGQGVRVPGPGVVKPVITMSPFATSWTGPALSPLMGVLMLVLMEEGRSITLLEVLLTDFFTVKVADKFLARCPSWTAPPHAASTSDPSAGFSVPHSGPLALVDVAGPRPRAGPRPTATC